MICKNRLLTSIESVHRALSAYSACICDEATPEECEMMLEYGFVLSTQLRKLRELAVKIYGADSLPKHLVIANELTSFKD